MAENPYEPPQTAIDPTAPRRWPYFGWLTPVVVWAPALLIFALAAPKFVEIFDELQQRGELPALSSYVLAAARFSRTLFHAPVAIFLIGLIVSDIAIADLSQRRKILWLHGFWQAAICSCGMIAAAVIVISLLLPIIRMAPTI